MSHLKSIGQEWVTVFIIIVITLIIIYGAVTTGGSYYWKDSKTGICYYHTGWGESETNTVVPCEKLDNVNVRIR